MCDASFAMRRCGESLGYDQPKKDRVRRLLPALGSVVLILAACTGTSGSGGDADVGNTGGSYRGGDTPSDELAQSLGVGSFDIETAADGVSLIITVYGTQDQELGTVTIIRDPAGDLVADYVGGDGETASYRAFVTEESHAPESYFIRTELTYGGRTLRTETEVTATETEMSDPATEWVQTSTLSTVLPEGQQPPPYGAFTLEDDGVVSVLEVVSADGSTVDTGQLASWFEYGGLGDLIDSQAMNRLVATVADEALHEWLHARIDEADAAYTGERFDGDMGVSEQAIHRSPFCIHFIPEAIAGTIAIACCVACKGALVAAGTGVGVVLTVILGTPSCFCCLRIGGGSIAAMAACWNSYSERWTNSRCASEWAVDQECSWGKPTASDHQHGCWCDCVDDSCSGYCDRLSGITGVPVDDTAGACSNGDCVCHWDPDAYCALFVGDNFCGGARIANLATGYIDCPTQICGNGRRDDVCGDTSRNEVCDPTTGEARGGCPEGQGCSDECACVDCGCDWQTQSGCDLGTFCSNATCQCEPGCVDDRNCPEGQVCAPNGGGCVEAGSCADVNGRECDAEVRWSCPNNERCQPDCTCATSCPDGVCDAELGEATTTSPTYCEADCPAQCGDGRCNSYVGESSPSHTNYCPGDCPEVQCCIDNNGCPSEELYSCPGDCCCCPAGAVCVRRDNRWTCGF